MSEQDGRQSKTKQRRSRKTNNANQQNGKQAPAAQRPTNDDREVWEEYWKAQGQPWRTEQEIDVKRQNYLDERREVKPDIEKSIYPFKDIKLTRADIEWLLATHENGRGPVVWADANQRSRAGLDLRGADLSKINLRELPLTGMIGGINIGEQQTFDILEEAVTATNAAAHMEEADLYQAHLERAILGGAQLEGARLANAHLEEAYLDSAHLEGAVLGGVHLEEAYLIEAHLEGAILNGAHLEKAILVSAHLEGASFRNAHLEGTYLEGAHFEGKIVPIDLLERLQKLDRWQKNYPSLLPPADLQGAFFDEATDLSDAKLGSTLLGEEGHRFVKLADVHWNGANLAVIDWRSISRLGDEYEARQLKSSNGENKDFNVRLNQYMIAVRANRQLALALQAQGLNEYATRFAYRAQVLQRQVFLLESLLPRMRSEFHAVFVTVAKKPRYKELAPPPKVVVKLMCLPQLLLIKTEEIQEDILTLNAFLLYPYLLPFQLGIFLYCAIISLLFSTFLIPVLVFYLLFFVVSRTLRSNSITRELYYQQWPKAIESSAAVGILLFHTTVDCLSYTLSLFLDLLTGYGYKPARSFLAYLLVITIFAVFYHQLSTHLAWNEAVVISMTAFHGRGFFPEQFHPGDPQALVAAIEAFVGLLIEVTFIATLNQRLFGK